jgi:hypothetical protein
VRGLRESATLGGRFLEADASYADLKRLQREHDEARQHYAALGSPDRPESGSHASMLFDQLADLRKQIADQTAAAHNRRVAELGGLVDKACAGDEPARSEISRLAVALPTAFATGFGEAVQRAAFSGSDFGPVCDEVGKELDAEADRWEASQRVVVRRVRVPMTAGDVPA